MYFCRRYRKKKLKEILTNVDAWICSPSPTYKIDKNILLKAKKLKVIFTPSTGSTHIDKKYLKKKKLNYLLFKKTKKLKKLKLHLNLHLDLFCLLLEI